jgi:anthranilate synthase component 2
MILLLDNYDSFTWNLYHYLDQLAVEPVEVIRNDRMHAADAGKFSGIVFSPGPGLPSEAGVMPQIISLYQKTIPMLGICLGHQALAEAHGARLENLDEVQHGVQREIGVSSPDDRRFKGIPGLFKAGLYHSWVVSRSGLPDDLIITATDHAGRIMALSHKTYPFSGVQFHPESVMTLHGKALIRNWLEYGRQYQRANTSAAT